MKFHFFHLMPYPYLPDDFDERFSSPSLTFPNRYFDRKLGHELYQRYMDEFEYADELGFDGIVCNEHHQSAYGIMPSPNVIAAALSRRTSKARIMILGNAIGLRDHPLRVAEEVAMIDHLCGGRLDQGFVRGIGWEYFGHSINPTASRSRFNEAHDLLIKAWTSEEMFEWYGEHYEFRYVNLWPRPLQDPYPPIFIPGMGSTETMKFCAKHRYSFMSVYAPTQIVKRWFDGYRSAAEEEGYTPDPEKMLLAIPVYVADTDAKAIEEAREPMEWLFHKGLKQGPEIFYPPGYMSLSSLRGVLSTGWKSFPETSYQELLDGDMILVGSPTTVAEKVEELRQVLGIGGFCVVMVVGGMSREHARHSMELFASEVMPQFRQTGVAEPTPA